MVTLLSIRILSLIRILMSISSRKLALFSTATGTTWSKYCPGLIITEKFSYCKWCKLFHFKSILIRGWEYQILSMFKYSHAWWRDSWNKIIKTLKKQEEEWAIWAFRSASPLNKISSWPQHYFPGLFPMHLDTFAAQILNLFTEW